MRGDFGRSVRFNRPAIDVVSERYPATFQLGGLAIFIALSLALPIGVYSAVRRGSTLDFTIMHRHILPNLAPSILVLATL